MILMDLNEQVDWDFGRALRKARLRRLVLRLRGKNHRLRHIALLRGGPRVAPGVQPGP